MIDSNAGLGKKSTMSRGNDATRDARLERTKEHGTRVMDDERVDETMTD